MIKDYSSLRKNAALESQWYLNKYGKLDWRWYDEGIVYAIQDYYGCKGEFTEDDVEFLKENGFIPEDFIEEDE